MAYRRCQQNGEWDDFIDVTQCRNTELTNLTERANNLDPNSVDVANKLQSISADLTNITTRSSGSLFPNDLNSTIEIIDTITRLLLNTYTNLKCPCIDAVLYIM